MSDKRKLVEQDTDSQDSDQLGRIEATTSSCHLQSSKEKKIRQIIEQHFDQEIEYKRYELEKINERIFEAQNMLDKLRVCIVCNFYSSNGQIALHDYINHPAISNLKCEHLEAAIDHCKYLSQSAITNNNTDTNEEIRSSSNKQQFDLKICVGNVSKYIKNTNNDSQSSQDNYEPSQYNQELITHKWMIYIRSPNCPKLDNYIKKVIFYLHQSYKPYDVVEVKAPPFQLAKRGWGEFPVHVQIHFKDERNKRIDINHNLKLDWTHTGLQTFGGETSCVATMVMKQNDYVADNDINSDCRKLQNLETKRETPSESLKNELNSQYQIEYESKKLPRNVSSSSLSSTSNSNVFSPFVNTGLATNPSPIDFISIEPDIPSTTSTANFDEVFQNLNKKEDNQTGSKSNNSSLNALLSLRPKTIQLTKQQGTNLILSTKTINSSKGAGGNNIGNQPIPNPEKTPFFNSLNKKLVIFKVSSDNSSSKDNEANSNKEKINLFSKSKSASLNCVDSISSFKKLKSSNEKLTNIKQNDKVQNVNSHLSKLDNLYTSNLLIEKIKCLNLEAKNLKYENLISESLRHYPIIGDYHKKRRKLSFSAQSIHEFYSWPYAKRRANEWIRAVFIKKKCSYLIEKYDLKSICPWSTKSIVLWLRSHGYTPLEYQHMQIMSLERKIMNYDENQVLDEFNYVDSLKPVNFIKKDSLWKKDSQNEKDSLFIDIVNIDPNESEKKRPMDQTKFEHKLVFSPKNHLEPCAETKYVQKLLQQLNLKTCLVNISGSNEPVDESNVFTCDLVERFLYRLAKRFAEDLIRQACSDVYFDSSRSDRLIESANRNGRSIESDQGCQKFPDYLNVVDIFNTINKHEKYDFLTNKYMARSDNRESLH